MAVLCEELTLSGVGTSFGGIQGVEEAGEGDRVLLTEAEKTVTLYKVSDQRPLGSWTVKQGQRVTCPAVYNSVSEEFVVVHDDKVLRIWKEDDVSLDKVFKTTLSADVCRIHSLPDTELLVLFRRGAVRHLDTLLTDPRQEVENVLADEETIRWSKMLSEDGQPILMFITEVVPDFYINIWKVCPRLSLRYKLQPFTENSRILDFAASLKKNLVSLLILYSTGHLCQTRIPLVESSEGTEILSVSSLLHLPEPIDSGALTILEDSHVATLTPSAAKQKDVLYIWNTSFQTLLDSEGFSKKTSRQLWNWKSTLYVPCERSLRILRYVCQPSSLASVLGRVSDIHKSAQEMVPIVSWEALAGSKKVKQSRKASRLKRMQDSGEARCQLQVTLSEIESASESQVSSLVLKALSSQNLPDFQIAAGKMMEELVDRCRNDFNFYPQSALIDLVVTRKLSYSLCPYLMALALDKSDVRLLQLCLCQFIDVPEEVLCSCLKMFLSVSEDVLRVATLDTTSAESYITTDEASDAADKPKDPSPGSVVQNGFSPGGAEEDGVKVSVTEPSKSVTNPCPVSLRRAILLNTVLTTAYSETFLLPHLKDLTSDQVILFLSYLQFLYMRCSQEIELNLPGQKELSVTQVIDWINLLLDANFTVLVVLPKAKPLLRSLQKCVRQQMRFYSELNKIGGSLTELKTLRRPRESCGKYSIEVLELY